MMTDGAPSATKEMSKDRHPRVQYGWLQLIPDLVNNLEVSFCSRSWTLEHELEMGFAVLMG